jgi:uncharacterized protein (DUF1330 family)
MAKGYIVVTEDIKDPEGFRAYMGEAAKSMNESVKVLAMDPKPEVLEGEWHGPQTILMEFESVDAAREWYNSELYQKAAKMRHAVADCKAVIFSGF